MGKPLDEIRSAVQDDRYLVSWHADERAEERGVTAWQLVANFDQAELIRERPRSKPNPSIVIRQVLIDGTEVEVIWSWSPQSRRAILVTVYFRDGNQHERATREAKTVGPA